MSVKIEKDGEKSCNSKLSTEELLELTFAQWCNEPEVEVKKEEPIKKYKSFKETIISSYKEIFIFFIEVIIFTIKAPISIISFLFYFLLVVHPISITVLHFTVLIMFFNVNKQFEFSETTSNIFIYISYLLITLPTIISLCKIDFGKRIEKIILKKFKWIEFIG